MFWNKKQVQSRDEFEGVSFKITPKTYPNTPDVAILEQKERHLYFAYHLLNNGHEGYVESGITTDPFQLWRGSHGNERYPVATHQIPEMRRIPCLPIKGRVLLLSTEEVIRLDEYTQNGLQFIRKRVEIRVPRFIETNERDAVVRLGRKEPFPSSFRRGNVVLAPTGGTVKAFMHIGIEEHFVNKLDGGFEFSPVKPFDMYNPRYLQFTVKDFDG